MGVSDREDAINNAGKLYRSLYCDNAVSQARIATSIWLDHGLELKEDFKKNAAEQFYASLHPVDFSDGKTSALMGKWVLEHTKGSIEPEIQFGPQQIMNIMNTIYFYDQWINEFQKSKTEQGDFYPEYGSTVETEFMNATFGSYGYRKGDGFTSSSLGLKENGSMIFVLPDEGMSVDSLLTTPDRLREALEGGEGHMGQVVFQVPKFTTDSRCDVRTMMENLGIKRYLITVIFPG